VLGAGIEEFSAAHSAKALRELIDRNGASFMIDQAAAWCKRRTRTTGQPDLDCADESQFPFTALYPGEQTIDTEQVVGVTSRSPRYYVSPRIGTEMRCCGASRDLLDVDRCLARDALEYALTIQLRNTGVHSRFIDGVVLEDGLELDEVVARLLPRQNTSNGPTTTLFWHRIGRRLERSATACSTASIRHRASISRSRLAGRIPKAAIPDLRQCLELEGMLIWPRSSIVEGHPSARD